MHQILFQFPFFSEGDIPGPPTLGALSPDPRGGKGGEKGRERERGRRGKEGEGEVCIIAVGRQTPLPLPFPISSCSPPCREAAPLIPARGSGERCKLPQRQIPSGYRIWCILSLKSDIWWQ